MSADELKAKGNAAFQAGDNVQAVNWFSQAINVDKDNYILYSNRSAAYCQDQKYGKALEDAEKTVSLKPDWAKGWSRKGAALEGMGKRKEAHEAYKKGLELDPSNDACKKGAAETQGPQGPRIIRPDQLTPEMMEQLMEQMRKERETNPSPPPSPKKKDESKSTKPLTDEEKEIQARIEKSNPDKEKGNELYKQKKFTEALTYYNKALEIAPENISVLLNIAATHLEDGNPDKCLEICEQAMTKANETRTDFTIKAKILARKGSALYKKGDLKAAIQAYKDSLTEHRIKATLDKLRQIEKEQEDAEKKAYLDPELAAQAKERGNEHFRNSRLPEAIKEYDEAIKRNPDDPTYYSNRAACYMKLFEYNHAMKDCEKALELNPKFVKAISRKASIHYFLKEYHKSLDWYSKALDLEPDNEDCKDGLQRTVRAINTNSGESDPLRAERAMTDPEIRAIMTDPIMQTVLRDLQENPASAQQHLQNPGIEAKIRKLIAAGIIGLGKS